jgi:hypothetical protein
MTLKGIDSLQKRKDKRLFSELLFVFKQAR